LVGGNSDIFQREERRRPPTAFVGHEREFSQLNMRGMELPWTRNVGLKWSKSSTPRWNVRRNSGRHGSMELAMETPSCVGRSSDCCRTKDGPGASWNDRRLRT